MNRITMTMLKGLLMRMSRTTGAPMGPPWVKREGGKGMRAVVVGTLILEQGSATYGNSWAICELMNEAGGERVIVRGSTARELWDAAQGWLDGYEACERR